MTPIGDNRPLGLANVEFYPKTLKRDMCLQKRTIFGLAAGLLLVTAAIVTTVVVLVNKESDSVPQVSQLEQLAVCLREGGVPEARIVAQKDTDYDDLNWQWNTLHGTYTPLAYLVAESDEDVAAGVRCGVAVGVRVVARSGGHSYAKFGYGDPSSLIIDVQRMSEVVVNWTAMVATIGAGARGGKVQHDLWAAGGLILPVGICPTVGIAGYTLGGGYGYFTRWLGTAADNLLEATMVDATGTLRVVNTQMDPELLWALRGGGGGNFGIVTSLKLKVHVAPTRIAFALAIFEFEPQFAPFFKSWQAFITWTDLPDHIGTFVALEEGVVAMALYSMEGSATELDSILETWFPPPMDVTIQEFTHAEFMLARNQYYSNEPLTNPGQLVNLTRHNAVGWKKVKSFYVDRVLTSDEDIGRLQALLRDYVQWNDLAFEHYGGAINRPRPNDTAFFHRNALYDVQLNVFSKGGDDRNTTEAVGAMERFFEDTKALLGHTHSYQNYLDEDLEDYLQRYYGPNLERLVAVKKRVDPDNVFHNPLSIPVSLNQKL